MAMALYPATAARRASSTGINSPSLNTVWVCRSIILFLPEKIQNPKSNADNFG
jgi:hypothetical protein